MNVLTPTSNQVSMRVERPSDPKELAQTQARRAQFQRNLDWLAAHAAEVYSQNRGRHICVAGQELFVADTAREALALAETAHPEDAGVYLRYIPRKKVDRVYAY